MDPTRIPQTSTTTPAPPTTSQMGVNEQPPPYPGYPMPPAPPGAVQPPFQPHVGYYYPPAYLPSTNPAFPSGDPQAAAPPANAVSSAPVPPHGPYPFPLPAPMVDPRHSMPPMQPNLHYPQPAPMPTSAQDASTAPSADPATSAPAGPPYPPQHPAPGGCPGGFPPWPQHPQQMMPYFPYGYPPNAPWTGQVAPPHGYPAPPHGYPTPPHGYPAPPHVQHPSAMYPPSTTPPAHQQQQPSEQQTTLPQAEPQTTSLPTETHTTPAPSVTQSYVEPTPPSSRTPSINGAPFSETRSTALSPLDQHTSPPSIGTQAPDPYPVTVSETALSESPVYRGGEFEANDEDRAADDSFEEFIATLKAKLEKLSLDERVEWVAAAFEQLGMQQSIDAIVDTFGADAVYGSAEKSS